ncbi:MAG: 16S rRNA (guanine(527)-N(7))-methyltransferase RsmG [Microbacteriaceae bacterium]|nr:16S rRNA (guanine(527)-N(7))-methyltransferase RsmG [Microbacteriaceae bacterium]
MKHSEIEAEPSVAAQLCGAGIERVRAFALDLGTRGEALGLIGPDEARRLWSRHILNCALLVPEIPPSGVSGRRTAVADVGSGAGLPGLVIAMIRPDVDVTLIEPLERRTRWLDEQVTNFALTNVTVFTGRAEDFTPRRSFDVVTARAVKSLKGLIPIVTPLVVRGGRLALLKGQRLESEIAEATTVFARHNISAPESRVLGEGTVDEPTRLFTAIVE